MKSKCVEGLSLTLIMDEQVGGKRAPGERYFVCYCHTSCLELCGRRTAEESQRRSRNMTKVFNIERGMSPFELIVEFIEIYRERNTRDAIE